MKQSTKRHFSLLMTFTMLLSTLSTAVSAVGTESSETHTHSQASILDAAATSGTIAPIEAADDNAQDATTGIGRDMTFTIEGNDTVYTLNTSTITPDDMATDEVAVDMENPNILVIESELRNIKVLNADGESVALTEEQIQTVLGMYQQYLGHWTENADTLGVQLPFFLQYNDADDGLGVLGEMLILGGVTVDDVREGNFSYDDLTGMIQNFMFGDALGVQFYGQAIKDARDEILGILEESGAQTEAQKLLILNDWLAHIDTFDMTYIMNSGKTPGEDPGTMVAPEPQNHRYYDAVYQIIYDTYEEQIREQFEGQIRDGLLANVTQQVYEAAIKQIIYDAAYNRYMENAHRHTPDAVFTWADPAEGATEPTATVVISCTDEACPAESKILVENAAAIVELDEEESIVATCIVEGVNVYTASYTYNEQTFTAEEKKSVAAPKVPHNFVDGKCSVCEAIDENHAHTAGAFTEFVWNADEEAGYTVDTTITCGICGEATELEPVVNVTSVKTDATCTEAGSIVYTATATYDTLTKTEEKTDEIAATGHTTNIVFNWKGTVCETATVTCANCTLNEVIDATVAEPITIDATCTAFASTTYTATAEYMGETVSDKKVIEGTEYADHTYDNGICSVCGAVDPEAHFHTVDDESAVFTWAEGYTATVKVTCAYEACSEVLVDEAPATVDSKTTLKATCSAEGEITYTATYTYAMTDSEKVFTDIKTEATPVDTEWGHDFGSNGSNRTCSICGAENPYITTYSVALTDLMDGEEIETPEESEKSELESAAEAYAEDYADSYMEEHAEEISADARGFVVTNFGEEAAVKIDAQVEYAIADIEANGMEVDPVNAPGYKMSVDEIVAMQMDTEMDDLGGMTPNQAIPVYAKQAAEGLTDGVLNYWEGSHFGVFGEGTSVCLGYAKAFAYIVQCMHPEIYGVNGASSDLAVAANWKQTADLYYDENGALDITANYAVDLVRVTFDASVTMFGETQDNFNSDHFWNAVKLDGKWYYVDPCYTDVFTEVMIRDRVETDGSMNHLYFMFSHSSAVSMYDGYYKEIKTLYDTAATHTDYEDSWMSRIKSNVYFDGDYAYYMYDSTDMLTMLEDQDPNTTIAYKLVRHKLSTTDAGSNGDSDYETLIYFNAEDGDSTVAKAYDTNGTELSGYSALLTELYAKHTEMAKIYPSISLTAALYNGKVYFNLANCILSYDLATGDIVIVKEYNTVHAARDPHNAFGGMAFDVVASADAADFTVENHPLAGLTIKNDGKMYVSVATNFAYISGNKSQTDIGYQYEESNYNPNYNTYTQDTGDYDDSMLDQYGYTKETNDNDEFMWAANFVETLDMSHFGGTSHSYASVSVDAFCGENAYTEDRCTTCGAIEAGSRVVTEESALNHHYILFSEEYYTKNEDNGGKNIGETYVCINCGFHIDEPTEPDPDADYSMAGTTYEEQLAIYEAELAIYNDAKANAGHTYEPTDATWSSDTSVTFQNLKCSAACCDARATTLDIFAGDNKLKTPVSLALDSAVTNDSAVATGYVGDCTEGASVVYTATGEASDKYGTYKYTARNYVKLEAGDHPYEGAFTWTETAQEDGSVVYTATATLTCPICGDVQENVEADVVLDEAKHVDATCSAEGQDVYTATATATNADGAVIGSAVEDKIIVIPALPHDYVDGICSVCGAVEIGAPTILSTWSKNQTDVKITWTAEENADGYEIWRATAIDAAEDGWTPAKTVFAEDAQINEDGSIYYRNKGLEVGVTYFYKVRAFTLIDETIEDEDALKADANRKTYDFSEISYMPAAVVFDNVYSNNIHRVRILWNEVNASDGYQIWRKVEGTDEWSVVKTIGDRDNTLTESKGNVTAYSNYDPDTVVPGETYVYKMRAFIIPEEGKKVFGAFSDEYTVAVMPETPVITVTAGNKAGRANIAWEAVDGAAGYQIYMTEEGTEFGTAPVKSITDGATTSYTKYDLEAGKTYSFKVRAYTEVEGKKTFGAYSEVVEYTVP